MPDRQIGVRNSKSCYACAAVLWAASFASLVCRIGHAASLPQNEWTAYLGSSDSEYCYSVTSDAAGNAYIAGTTEAAPGAFLAKFDSAGNQIWQRHWGNRILNPQRLASDGLGNIYIAGQYVPPTFERSYAILAKFDDGGNLHWVQQLALGENSLGLNVSADRLGNVFLCGTVLIKPTSGPMNTQAFVGQFDSDGSQRWIAELGTSAYDEVAGIVADQLGNVYFAGSTYGNLYGTNLGDKDAIVGKLDHDGNLIWGRQFGTNQTDIGVSLALTSTSDFYMLGNTDGTLISNPDGYNPFVRKYDAAGMELWTRQLETESLAFGIATDEAGSAYVGGFQYIKRMAGDGQNLIDDGDRDVLVAKYDGQGQLKWTTTFGGPLHDEPFSISASPGYGIYLGGYTWNSYSPFQSNASLWKVIEVPEPGSALGAALIALLVVNVRTRTTANWRGSRSSRLKHDGRPALWRLQCRSEELRGPRRTGRGARAAGRP